MLEIEYPLFRPEEGRYDDTLIKHFTTDKTKILVQQETGGRYVEAVDVYPCQYTYVEVDRLPEEYEKEDEVEEVEDKPEEEIIDEKEDKEEIIDKKTEEQ